MVNILLHDVERIERLITDYSQMLKDEVAITNEKMKEIDLNLIAASVVDDFNNIHNSKSVIKIQLSSNGSTKYNILGIDNRIEQIIANLLDNAISFSKNGQNVEVKVTKNLNNQVIINIILAQKK